MWFFTCGSGPDSKLDDEKVKIWKAHLNTQRHTVQKEINRFMNLDSETEKLIKTEYADRPKSEQKLIITELVKIRKTIGQLYGTVSLIKSVENALVLHVSQVNMGKVIGKSAEILKLMNKLVSVSSISKIAQELGKELEKADIIQEMLTERQEEEEEKKQVEEILDAEVEAVLLEVFQKLKTGTSTQSDPKTRAESLSGSHTQYDPKTRAESLSGSHTQSLSGSHTQSLSGFVKMTE